MTPLKGLTFVYNEIFLNRTDDKEIWYEFMQWSDNPYHHTTNACECHCEKHRKVDNNVYCQSVFHHLCYFCYSKDRALFAIKQIINFYCGIGKIYAKSPLVARDLLVAFCFYKIKYYICSDEIGFY